VKFKTAFSKPVRYAYSSNMPSCAKQSFAKECDINTILAKWQRTGMIEHLNTHNGQYGEFLSASSYHEAMNSVLEADQAFSTLPSSVRAKFANDPAAFLAFVEDPNNRDEMIELGLMRDGVVSDTIQSDKSIDKKDSESEA
jgi:phage internal scaffolding protein